MARQKKILITGNCGFIGYHLAHSLCQKHHHVLGIDSISPYYNTDLKLLRKSLLDAQGIETIMAPLKSLDLEKLLEEQRITHVVHLAAQAGVRYSLKNPHSYIDANIDSFVHLLEALKHHRHIPLVYASSSSVYGLNQTTPFCESHRTDAPASLYGATKKANELLAHTYHHLYQIKATGLRFFTVYGPYGRPDMAYFSFAQKIITQQPIQLFNQGHMQRDFTYIDDIVAGIESAIDKELDHRVINLGNNQPEKLSRFVELLETHLKTKAHIEYAPMQPGDVVETFADIRQAQALLNFNPQTSLEQGLASFCSWFLAHERFHQTTP